jgi:hypothetical protein
MMMQPTHLWHFPDQSNLRPLDPPRHRTIYVQGLACPPAMIILEVAGQEPPETALVQDNYVVQAFAADTPDQPLHIGILPWALGGDEDVFEPVWLTNSAERHAASR